MRLRRLAPALMLALVLLLAAQLQSPAGPAWELAPLSAGAVEMAEQTSQAVAPVARQVEEEAERLRQHLAERARFVAPARDPFRFSGPAKRPAPQTDRPEPSAFVPAMIVARAPDSPPILLPTLIALTEDAGPDGVVVRTAVLAMGDDMAMVKTGQTFSRFQVQSIGATSVELVDVTSPTKAVTIVSIR